MENFTIQKLVYYSLLNLQSIDTLQKGNIAMSMYFAAKYTQNKVWEKKDISILRQNLLKDTKSEMIDCILPCLKRYMRVSQMSPFRIIGKRHIYHFHPEKQTSHHHKKIIIQ